MGSLSVLAPRADPGNQNESNGYHFDRPDADGSLDFKIFAGSFLALTITCFQ